MTQMLRSLCALVRTHFLAASVLLFGAVGSAAEPAAAIDADPSPADKTGDSFAYIMTGPSRHAELTVTEAGLKTLGGAVRRRTSLTFSDALSQVRLDRTKGLSTTPLWTWRDADVAEGISERLIATLRSFFAAGGMLWVDAPDGSTEGPFIRQVTAILNSLWPEYTLTPVPSDHVIFKSFYLIDGSIGRLDRGPAALGLFIDGRLRALVTRTDVLGAIAQRDDGTAMLPMNGGNEAQREMSLRFGINWLMYTQCLDYKNDQVHLPFLLKRRP